MPLLLRFVAPLLALALAACGSSDPPATPAPDGEPEPFDAPTTTVDGSIEKAGAPAGGEDTICIHKRLGNAEPGYVRNIRGTLGEGSHHLIAYVSDETEEQLEPAPCGGFSGILVFDEGGVPGLDSANVPIFIAQQPEVELQMPMDDGHPVGFRIEANQMLRFELHWFNTTGAARDVKGNLELDLISEADAQEAGIIESSFGFWGSMSIDIPPHSQAKTPLLFQSAISGTKSFAVTTHQHHLGTRMRIWHDDGSSVGSTEVGAHARLLADSDTWAEPPLEMLDPAITFADGQGLAYQCEWNNTTDKHVGFGEGFDDEMCFLWSYYYPSDGFDICVHFNEGSAEGVCNHLLR